MRRVPWRALGELVPAAWYLARAQAAMTLKRSGTLLTLAPAEAAPAVRPDAAALTQAQRCGRAIVRVASVWPLPARCLVRSLALRTWLEARGIPGVVLRLGVRKRDTGVEAHAWITVGDAVVGDAPAHVASFTPLAAAAAARMRW